MKLTDAERLARARRGEENTRPVTAEIRVNAQLRTATLRLLGKSGAVEDDRNAVPLPGEWSYECGPLRTAAGQIIAERGYRLAGGWSEIDDLTARTPIEPTGAYLAFVERMYGPAPEVSALPDGVTARSVQRGRWRISKDDRTFWDLTWQPRLDGDVWTLWGGPGATQIVSRSDSPAGALAAIATSA
ncbi:hypothetical protein [Streptomyces sp. SAI-090]|jgi:hypothetical protein|uniref:hypothetical protein n=1 Tax=Streptomyces sp. SAI-090 TaxID=2940545 RepID=UPI00247532C4|nr:hypothetical protein [Streptomyces sp. SAI-090]MDH6522429.1 hypothetical protein [Streptomyces sp. SAI-090]